MRTSVRVVAVGILCGLVMVGTGRGAFAAGAAPPDQAARVDLNSASADDIARLPGIGAAKARAIVEHRSEAPFKKPEDLKRVKGIGDKLYDRVKDRITVGEPAGAHGGRGS
jgi:competence protein ComEA